MQILGEAASNDVLDPPAYVERFRPERVSSMDWLVLTRRLEDALRWPDFASAHSAYMTSIGTRWDGQPDRPLTAFSVQIFDPDRGEPFRARVERA
jgi:hypothetical protein